jgi:hypothetical protein
MASQKRPAQQSVTVSTVTTKEILLILAIMIVLAGTAATVTLLS